MARWVKVLLILVVIFGIIGFGCARMILSSKEDAKELNLVAKTMISDLAAHHWDNTTINKYASSELKEWLIKSQSPKITPTLNRLGKMTAYKDIKQYHITQSYTNNTRQADIICLVQFEKSEAEVSLILQKENKIWKLYKFNISTQIAGGGNTQ